MDCGPDNCTIMFDPQSNYVSFEERRWIANQRKSGELDKLVKSVADFNSHITGDENFSVIPSSVSSKSLITEIHLQSNHSLYDTCPVDGLIDSEVDQFRLYHQQIFQLLCADLSKEKDYQIFFSILEGSLFYVASTVDKYKALHTHELRRCFSSFTTFIQTRTNRILTLLCCFPKKRSFPRYKLVHSYTRNNCGVLFELLPKIPGIIPPKTECDWIFSADTFGHDILSPEELRYIDYSLNLKQTDPMKPAFQPLNNATTTRKTLSRNNQFPVNLNSIIFPVLHSLPIVYPYDEDQVYANPFPTFWQRQIHQDETITALFQTTPLSKNTPEYNFVERSFYKTVEKDQLKLAYIERVENPHLWQKFSAHRSFMKKKNGVEYLNEQWMYHGTKSVKQHDILAQGFNRSYCKDGVFFGRGVYFSRFASYSERYSDQNDLSCIFLCRVLVGHHHPGVNDMRVPPMKTLPNGKTIQVDSTTDPKPDYTIVVTYHDDQNYPEYIIGYTRGASR